MDWNSLLDVYAAFARANPLFCLPMLLFISAVLIVQAWWNWRRK